MESRVRGISCDPARMTISCLLPDQDLLVLVSPNMQAVHKYKLQGNSQTMSLAADPVHGLIAAAGSETVNVMDPRSGEMVLEFKHEHNGGIRSLAWNGSLLALGGSELGTSFYDVTANAWLQQQGYTLPPGALPPPQHPPSPFPIPPPPGAHSLSLGRYLHDLGPRRPNPRQLGSRVVERVMAEMLSHTDTAELVAVYTLAWDWSGRQLLVAGGPVYTTSPGFHCSVLR
ncbi:MAG: hypothetical protein WDW38_003453 [Sanguina aurantia]